MPDGVVVGPRLGDIAGFGVEQALHVVLEQRRHGAVDVGADRDLAWRRRVHLEAADVKAGLKVVVEAPDMRGFSQGHEVRDRPAASGTDLIAQAAVTCQLAQAKSRC